MDLWSLADFAVPGYLGTREHFVTSLAEQPGLLAGAIKPLILRREVADVATDLPERVDADVAIDMFEGELAGYEELISSIRGQANRGNALALITRLRQLHGTSITRIRSHAGGSNCDERQARALN